MGHLMGKQQQDAALLLGWAVGEAGQQVALRERDGAPMLHGAGRIARQRDEIELRQRIFHAEIVIEILEQRGGVVERTVADCALPARGDDPDRDAVCLVGEPLELARRQQEQIARHAGGALEGHALAIAAQHLLTRNRRIRDRQEMLRYRHGQLECGLERWLVPTWKDAASVSWLGVAGDHLLAAAEGLIVDGVDAAAVLVDRRRIANPQIVTTDRNRMGKREDRKSTRLNSSHLGISYAVFCLT